ncbi:epoxide hydrolase [Aaosphaeria arxii CBS 175.79]|uniref:Epoxide hydrolase n=1 Tax=Aaosphaeria arxii CBS 175.79 TaxID=1450172 RepID=A0A6A5Y5G4_9PLEO|nr:epoxide hydrolase [Aaosphaeria arxii CBS 175.79]KAF2020081.1 epoxide hydrolase [Aaosphaeria arxii CBS 175.79]
MEDFERKTLVTRRLLKYTYYISSPNESALQHPTLLFVHGFPDSAHLWSDVIASLQDLPNKIIVPDCLGYAGTDKPDDTSLYAYKDQAQDLVDILEHESAVDTIIIGHDWGSALTQRTYLHNCELFSGMILLNAGYMVPSNQPFNLAAVNEVTERTMGYPQFAYWEFFTAPDAAEIIDGNLERMWQVLHGDVQDWMKELFCVPGAMRKFLLGKEDVPLKAYASQSKWKDRFMQQFKADGFASALQMYKATVSNVQFASDSTIPKENITIKVPLLFLICTKDAVCVPEMMLQAKSEGLVPQLEEVRIECAHWSPMEEPEAIAAHIREFLVKRFPRN